jgi:hypothetical protein
MKTIDYIIMALAVFRITRLVTTDVVLNKVRDKIWKKFPPEDEGIGYLITCDWCSSIWVSTLVLSVYRIAPTPVIAVLGIFALSAVTGLLSRVG